VGELVLVVTGWWEAVELAGVEGWWQRLLELIAASIGTGRRGFWREISVTMQGEVGVLL
jgi:hypothetical protein